MKGYDDFFIVKKESSFDFCDFKFLARAVSTDSNRFFLQFIYCEKEGDHFVMVATDGFRMHLLRPAKPELYGIQEGYYQILTNTAKEIIFAHCDESIPYRTDGYIDHGQFPDYKKVMPNGTVRDTLKDICFSKKGNDVRSLVSFAKKLDSNLSMDINKLYDLAPFEWNVDFYESELKAVNFTCKNKQAVIMPMNEA
jgi:hypothetical protein